MSEGIQTEDRTKHNSRVAGLQNKIGTRSLNVSAAAFVAIMSFGLPANTTSIPTTFRKVKPVRAGYHIRWFAYTDLTELDQDQQLIKPLNTLPQMRTVGDEERKGAVLRHVRPPARRQHVPGHRPDNVKLTKSHQTDRWES